MGHGGERTEVQEQRCRGLVSVNEPHRLVADEVNVIAVFLYKRTVPLPVDDSSSLLIDFGWPHQVFLWSHRGIPVCCLFLDARTGTDDASRKPSRVALRD
jgi:hypothetical protein